MRRVLAAGDWDMCTNGRYTERGIKARHGYASERYRIHPEYLSSSRPRGRHPAQAARPTR